MKTNKAVMCACLIGMTVGFTGGRLITRVENIPAPIKMSKPAEVEETKMEQVDVKITDISEGISYTTITFGYIYKDSIITTNIKVDVKTELEKKWSKKPIGSTTKGLLTVDKGKATISVGNNL